MFEAICEEDANMKILHLAVMAYKQGGNNDVKGC